jgi:methionyl-tRNA formyltransferase
MKASFCRHPRIRPRALAALLAAGFDIPLVLTQPDRPAGRGMKLQPSPVKQFALAHGLAVAQPRSLRRDGKYPDDAEAARQAAAGRPGRRDGRGGLWADPAAVGAGSAGQAGVLEHPRLLLPRWRGAAPIHRAIEAGDAETGITIMQMDAGLDTGDMLLTERLPIDPRATTAGLHDELAALGGRLIVEALELAACGGLAATCRNRPRA